MKILKESKSSLYNYLPQIFIVTVILFLYIQNLWFGFSYLDDNLIVFDEFEKINSLSKIPEAFLGGYLFNNYYRPMIMSSFIIDTVLAGQSSMMYHATNIIIHIIFTLLLYNLLLKINIRKNIALFCTLIFAIHPINLNAVSWIVGRNDLIVGLFSLLSIVAFIDYLRNSKTFFLIAHLVFFVLAMFSKEIGMLIPFVLITYVYFYSKDTIHDRKKLIMLVFFWTSLPALYLFIRFFIVNIRPQEQLGLITFLKNLYILLEYIAKLVYLPAIIPLSLKNTTLILLGGVFSVIIILLVIKNKWFHHKKFLWGIIFFFTFIIPTLIVRLQTKDGEFVYIDCRVYLPFVGLVISTAAILSEIKIKKYQKNFLAAGLLLYLIFFSIIKNAPYSNGELFWNEVIKNHPSSPYNWIGLGFFYFDNGEYLKAAECAETAIKLNPTIDTEFYFKAVLAYESAGDFNSANKILEDVLIIETDSTNTIAKIIQNSIKIGDINKANFYGKKFLELKFKDKILKSDLCGSIAYYYAQSNNFKNAIRFMKIALIEKPNNPTYNNDLGVFYLKDEVLDSARFYIERSLEIEPGNNSFKNNLQYINSLPKREKVK